MSRFTALIAGATGAIGGALARELGRRPEWEVVGVSRRKPASPIAGVAYVQADLTNAADSKTRLGAAAATHLFYCGRATHGEQTLESAEDNLRLLENVLNAAETPKLSHVHLVQGGKYYGVHVGPFPTPARENQPRAIIDNFNYDQEDFLRHRSKSATWSWSASRPNTLLHFSPDIARNLVSTLGVLAAISRETGAALDFPGPPGAYTSLAQVTTIELLARAMVWMSTEPACENEAFNVTNTDLFRWNTIWPRFADAYEIPVGSVRPLRLAEVMRDKEAIWQRVCNRHGLKPSSLKEVANWAYADATLERYWDEILSHNKARRFGFDEWDDSEERFFATLDQYREARVLP